MCDSILGVKALGGWGDDSWGLEGYKCGELYGHLYTSFDDPPLYMIFEGWDELEMMCVPVYIPRWLLGLVLGLVGSETQFHECPWVHKGLLCEVGGYQDISVSPVVREGDTPRGRTLFLCLLAWRMPISQRNLTGKELGTPMDDPVTHRKMGHHLYCGTSSLEGTVSGKAEEIHC